MPHKNQKIRLNGLRKDELILTTLAAEAIQRTKNTVWCSQSLSSRITLLSISPIKRADDTLTDLGFAQWAQCIDFQPFIYTVLVKKVRTWQLSQFIIVGVFC